MMKEITDAACKFKQSTFWQRYKYETAVKIIGQNIITSKLPDIDNIDIN